MDSNTGDDNGRIDNHDNSIEIKDILLKNGYRSY